MLLLNKPHVGFYTTSFSLQTAKYLAGSAPVFQYTMNSLGVNRKLMYHSLLKS